MTSPLRALIAGVVALVALSATPGTAAAVPILAPADAAELVEALAEAYAVQGVCYGWSVIVQDDEGSSGGADVGSHTAVGSRIAERECPRYVVFMANIHYTSSWSEAEDDASFSLRTNIPGGPTTDSLKRVGIRDNALLGDDDDVTVANAVSALPLLVADLGLAPPVPLEANTDPLPAGDAATGQPGSDLWRQNAFMYVFLMLLFVGAAGWLAYAIVRRADERRPQSSSTQTKETSWNWPQTSPPD